MNTPKTLKQISLSIITLSVNKKLCVKIRRGEVTEDSDGIPLLTFNLRIKVLSGKITTTFAKTAITERIDKLSFISDKESLLKAFPKLPYPILIVIRNNILIDTFLDELSSKEPTTLWSLLYQANLT